MPSLWIANTCGFFFPQPSYIAPVSISELTFTFVVNDIEVEPKLFDDLQDIYVDGSCFNFRYKLTARFFFCRCVSLPHDLLFTGSLSLSDGVLYATDEANHCVAVFES